MDTADDLPWYDHLDLSARARSAIINMDAQSLEVARLVPKEAWSRMQNCGRKTTKEIMTALRPRPNVTPALLHTHESVLNLDGWPAITRLRVPGGWLYLSDKGSSSGMAFVPDEAWHRSGDGR